MNTAENILNTADKVVDDVTQSKLPNVIQSVINEGLGNITDIIKRTYAPKFNFGKQSQISHVGRNFNKRKLKKKKKKKNKKGKGIGSIIAQIFLPSALDALNRPDD
jgi:hypothetical protein